MSKIEPIVGRYIHVDVEGTRYRIYFEEGGGRHPFGLPAYRRRRWATMALSYRPRDNQVLCVIAFDMPRHGKSNPPEGYEKEVYRLTAAAYVAVIRAFCAALDLKRPVVIGCSVGGRIVLDLARYHGTEFRGLIGVQCSNHHQPWYDSSWLNRPDVHGGEICAAIVSGMMAPPEPPKARSRNALVLHAGRPRDIQRRSLFLWRRRRFSRGVAQDRYVGLPTLHSDRRIRLFLYAGRQQTDC